MQKSKLAGLGLGLLVALVFISSYISLTNYNSQSQKTTSIPATYASVGITKGKLIAYTSPFYFNIVCKNASIDNATAQIINENLSILQNNNSILTSYPVNSKNISVAAANMSVYSIYKFITSKLSAPEQACVSAYSNAVVFLPQAVNMTIGNQRYLVGIPSLYRNATFISPISRGINQTITVKIYATVAQNGTVYGTPQIVILNTSTASKPTVPSNTLATNSMQSNSIVSNTMNSNTIGSNAINSNSMNSNSMSGNTLSNNGVK